MGVEMVLSPLRGIPLVPLVREEMVLSFRDSLLSSTRMDLIL